MKDITNSTTLKMALDNAVNVGDVQSTSVTAERLLVAAIDLTLRYEKDGKMAAFSQLLYNTGRDLNEMRRILLQHINAHKTPEISEIIHFQKLMKKARQRVVARAGEEIRLVDMVQCIFDEPTKAITQSLTSGKTMNKTEAPEVEIDLSWLLDDMDEEPVSSYTPEKHEPKDWVADLVGEVTDIRNKLLDAVFGQDNAVSVVAAGYFQALLLAKTDRLRTRPQATFLFAGPPGVGKTFLAEKTAEILGRPFRRFDMSEYSDSEAIIEFCGSDKVYKNGKAGNVTSFLSQNPECVLLFDEIEKAHLNIIHLFLQILDAGRIRDNFTDDEISLSRAIIIFTTNAGKQLYENSESGDFSGVSRKIILKALQKDVNPETGIPYFPAAICSRFASGNVVMFNHIASHNLRDIAKKEIMRHADNFAREIGIDVEIEEEVFTSILFAEGGAADARTVRSRAETFFDDELFELFRLMTADKTDGDISALEKIIMRADLPKDSAIRALFEKRETTEILVFGSKAVSGAGWTAINAKDWEEGAKLLSEHDIGAALIDISSTVADGEYEYLNIEDIRSEARDFLYFIREKYRDIPVYLLLDEGLSLDNEELLSFTRMGVRGCVSMGDELEKELNTICSNLHQQKSMDTLAKANKTVSFETAQSLRDGGKTAVITLFDFKMTVAIDPDDDVGILSNVSKPDVKFDDIIGAEDAKKELQYFVEYLKNPKKYLGTGLQAPKGVLLYGPPGTGKTMLAKAMASESDVTFITAEGNQFLKRYVGEGSEKVHELFRTARKYAPSILFVDEIDAIAKERRGGEQGAGSEETLTAFLTEMDGFKNDPSKPVFVLAATNFDVTPGSAKSLDPALMRRFDRRVYIDLPDRDDRVKYISMQIGKNSAYDISKEAIDNMAMRSAGMSLAELESVLEMALRTAVREGGLKVTDAVLEEAFETFNNGEAKAWDISQLERVARHESGHAFVCWHSGECPSYLTVVARGNHGGYMQHADNEGKAIYTKDELLAKIRTSLGGRAAEIVYYGEKDGISTGASGDLEAATRIARQIICSYGMDESFGLAVIDPQTAQSGELSAEVRAAVNKILAEEMRNAINLIAENKDVIDELVSTLLKKDHLSGKEIDAILSSNN